MQLRCGRCGNLIEAANFCPYCGEQQNFVRPVSPVYSAPPYQAAPPAAPVQNVYAPPPGGYAQNSAPPAAYNPAQGYNAPPVYQAPPAAPAQAYQPPAPAQSYQPQAPYAQNTQNNPQPAAPAYNPWQGYNAPPVYQTPPAAPVQSYQPPAPVPVIFYPAPQQQQPAAQLRDSGQNAGSNYQQNNVHYGEANVSNRPQNQNYGQGNPYRNQSNNTQLQPYGNSQNTNYAPQPAQKEGKSYGGSLAAVLLLPFIPLYEFLQRHFGRGTFKLLLLAAMITMFCVANTPSIGYNTISDSNYNKVNYAGNCITVQYNNSKSTVYRIEEWGYTEVAGERYPTYGLTYVYGSVSNGNSYKPGAYIRIGNYAYKLNNDYYYYDYGYDYYYSDSNYYYDISLTFVGDYQYNCIRQYYVSYPNEGWNAPAVIILWTLAIWQFVDFIVILCKLASGQKIVKKKN